MSSQRKVRQNIFLMLLISPESIALVIATGQFNLQEWLQGILLWVQSLGSIAAIVFIAIYILATVLFIPGSILTLGGGALFGLLAGSVYVFVAAMLGATLAFLIGRYLTRDWVARKIAGNAKFTAIDRAVAREGLKIVLLTRLSPVFPFNLLNYAFGITQVSLQNYVLGTIGILPGTILYVYIGSLAGGLTQIGAKASTPEAELLQWLVRIVGLLATIAVTVFITRIARKALDQTVAPGEDHVTADDQ